MYRHYSLQGSVETLHRWPISPISPISPMQCFYRLAPQASMPLVVGGIGHTPAQLLPHYNLLRCKCNNRHCLNNSYTYSSISQKQPGAWSPTAPVRSSKLIPQVHTAKPYIWNSVYIAFICSVYTVALKKFSNGEGKTGWESPEGYMGRTYWTLGRVCVYAVVCADADIGACPQPTMPVCLYILVRPYRAFLLLFMAELWKFPHLIGNRVE